MTFNQWYATHEWYHSQRDEMKEVWEKLVDKGFSADETGEIMDRIISCIRDEYGD